MDCPQRKGWALHGFKLSGSGNRRSIEWKKLHFTLRVFSRNESPRIRLVCPRRSPDRWNSRADALHEGRRTIQGTGAQFFIDNPEMITPLLIVIGIILVCIGFLLLIFTYSIGKGAIIVDKEISSAIDKNFRSKDRLSQLERLANLRERGVLTEEQFEAERTRILSSSTEEKWQKI